MKSVIIRRTIAAIFLLITVAGLTVHAGWGSVCSFGIDTLSAICPLGAIQTFVSGHPLKAGAAVALVIFILSVLLLGRFFCGWVCPVALTHADKLPKKKRIPIKAIGCGEKKDSALTDAGWSLSILGGALLSSAVFGFQVFCLVCPVGLIFGIAAGLFTLVTTGDAALTLPVFAGILIAELVFLRRWCHRFCPIGALIALIAKANRFLQPSVNKATCLRAKGQPCSVCQNVCPEGIDPASDIKQDMSRCTRCRRCQESCPAAAISFPLKPGKAAAPRSSAPRPAFEGLQAQARRCLQCGRCTEACPAGKPIAQAIALAAAGKSRAAGALLCESGYLPDLCSQVCSSSRLCEAVCPAKAPIPIAALEHSLSETVLSRGIPGAWRKPLRGKPVAVVGSGPAGLACAESLCAKGAAVTVYEADATPGGLLQSCIDPAKMNRTLLHRRITILREKGVVFQTSVRVGKAISWESLLRDHQAVFVATGAPVSVSSGLQSSSSVEVCDALAVLRDHTAGRPRLSGRHVVVCGAGDTALDVIAAALQQNAASVRCVIRKKLSAIRADRTVLARLMAQGAQFTDEARVSGVCEKTAAVTVRAGNAEHTIPCDTLIPAFGLMCETDKALAGLGITYDSQSHIELSGSLPGQTANPAIFAGGDAVRGAELVVTAVADGRSAADGIQAFLTGSKA